MELNEKIPVEILQKFSPAQAWEYLLVPYESGDQLRCYGELGKEYSQIALEVEVLLGLKVEIQTIDKEELITLLKKCYKKSVNSQILNGQNFLKDLIKEAFDNYASDIHLEPSEHKNRVRFRIDGRLMEKYMLENQQYASLINQIKILSNLDISEKRLPQDGRIMYKDNESKFDIRVSSLPTIYGEKMVLRLLTRHIELLDLNNLGFTYKQITDYSTAINKPHGLILISGPTGSGKSTTLYATLRLLNKETNNILTIEDPVEYTLEGINQVQLKEEIGLTFSSALRTFLRQDPDIIMLGEIRDAETAQMAIRSSLTGHLILSTIHTNSAYGSVFRLIDMGIHPYLIANTLRLCVSQRLVRILCPYCKKEYYQNSKKLYKAIGCDKCSYTGYKGRKAIYEVIPIGESIAESIKKSENNIEEILNEQGITSLDDAATNIMEKGETTMEEIMPLIQTQ